MPYCPECRRKYREGSYLCPSCNRTLVDVLAPRNEGDLGGGGATPRGGEAGGARGEATSDSWAAGPPPTTQGAGAGKAAAQLDCVGVYYAEVEAQLAAGLLSTMGIPYLVKRATESPCYLYVRREDVRTAQKLLGSPPKDRELREEGI